MTLDRRIVIKTIGLGTATTMLTAPNEAETQNVLDRFQLESPRGRADQTMDVFFHRPVDVGPNAPVLFIMHGNGRNARSYLRAWTTLADRAGVVLLAPHFSRELFPNSRDYNQGEMFDAAGVGKPVASWSFTVVEQAFDAYRARFGSTRSSYLLYGHSAGSQFVHRFMLFMPRARVERAVAANAGFYTMPDASLPYPYGTKGTSADKAALGRWFGRRLTVLLGDQDIDPEHVDLVRTPEANLQGPHRLARGEAFFAAAQRAAGSMGASFSWDKKIIPGVDHNNGRVAPAAARILFG